MVRRVRPTILIGTTASPDAFTEAVIRAMADTCPRPVILPLSNPTSNDARRIPADIAGVDGRPGARRHRQPVRPGGSWTGTQHRVGQANNAFVFPGVGLGAIVAGARHIDDAQFLVAAHTLAGLVSKERLAEGALYPPISDLRAVSREIAVAVVCSLGTLDGQPLAACEHGRAEAEAVVDAAMWWPEYPAYEPA